MGNGVKKWMRFFISLVLLIVIVYVSFSLAYYTKSADSYKAEERNFSKF